MNQVQYSYYIYFFTWLPAFFRFKLKRKIERKLPKAWNDLSGDQLGAIIKLLNKETDSYKIKLGLLKILLNFKWYRLLSLTPVQVCQLTPLTDFIFSDLSLTKNLIPFFRLPARLGKVSYIRYYGPGDRFRNLCLSEFIVCENFYMQYIKAPEDKKAPFLDKLIASLYRPMKANYNPKSPEYTGDIREKFNDHLIEERAKEFAGLDREVKLSILYYYQGCRKELEALYKEVFSGEESNRQVANPWLILLGAIPSEKFGTIPELESQNLHQVLFHLNRQIIDNKERLGEMEAKQNNKF